ncbi:MAG: cytochrome c3 family protein [Myxococcota bacterium]
MRAAWSVVGLAVAGILSIVGWRSSVHQEQLASEAALRGVSYVGSDACASCHPDHHRSWHRTFHRTMTQEASDDAVLAPFDGRSLTYGGVVATFYREGEEFRIHFSGPGQPRTARVARTVGSRRYQQFLAREGNVYIRLPVAWHIEERRFIHMNSAFLTPDPQGLDEGRVDAADYDRHVTRWNDNCVFCHNVAPNPGLDGDRFDTEVAELGIACEACHGPGARHAAENRDPLRRYRLHLGPEADPSIVNPERLSPERSSEVCGRCHGQRITDDLSAFLVRGDPFIPGEDLSRYSEPLFHDSSLDGERVFGARFWSDGTPRLTAYEYQGLLQSSCANDPEFACTSCHGMHEGDPRGQLRPRDDEDELCTTCHSEYADAEAEAAHSEHPATLECTDCHMPKVVYGLIGAHRSHRIEIPDPAADRPDACTLCHVERSKHWASAALGVDGEVREGSALERLLAAGDPIERALAAAALGRPNARNRAQDGQRMGLLVDAMVEDSYPAVRFIAARSLRSLAAPIELDYREHWGPTERRRWAEAFLRAQPGLVLPDPARQAALRAESETVAIEIGE